MQKFSYPNTKSVKCMVNRRNKKKLSMNRSFSSIICAIRKISLEWLPWQSVHTPSHIALPGKTGPVHYRTQIRYFNVFILNAGPVQKNAISAFQVDMVFPDVGIFPDNFRMIPAALSSNEFLADLMRIFSLRDFRRLN